jgi:hypothetical protein
MRYIVTLPLRPHNKETPSDWAREYCKSYRSSTWHINEDTSRSKADYHFGDEKDAAWFKIRWA